MGIPLAQKARVKCHIWHASVQFVLQDIVDAQAKGFINVTNYKGELLSCFPTIGQWREDLVELMCMNVKKIAFTGIFHYYLLYSILKLMPTLHRCNGLYMCMPYS